MPVIFAHFVCALLGFFTCTFPAKSETNGTFFVDQRLYDKEKDTLPSYEEITTRFSIETEINCKRWKPSKIISGYFGISQKKKVLEGEEKKRDFSGNAVLKNDNTVLKKLNDYLKIKEQWQQ